MKELNQEIFEKQLIVDHAVEKEITQSYIDYAMSVIISRALPDARDGLKPVQRRILYAMYDMKLMHNSKYRKSAAVVGEVLGKYHPHGDSSVYEAMVRMAQPFSLRYPLIDGQGNFGSIDGDGAAAMRYTEARLTKIAEEMLQDIDLDTVDWRDNYDSSRQEPCTLPTKFPNHLCNGTMGIAVGMATNMAPHNLMEVIEASLAIIENPEISIDEIMQYIKGPDFPTGGIIFDSQNIKEVYSRGKGGITIRGKTHIEEKKGHQIIVIDELPYQVNKANLVAKIAEIITEKKLDGIQDITDESSKNDIRITITLKKGVNPDHILTMIYKYTDLQTNFNLNNVILVEKGLQPRLLNIKDLLEEFVNYRRYIVYRRSVFLLNKAKDRLHILEGLQKAISILDDVIATIRGSQTRNEAKDALIKNFDFSEQQAEYILMLRLQTLVGLEIQKILDEIGEKQDLIKYLEGIIKDPKKLDGVVIDELIYIKDEYGDKRRTEVSNDGKIYDLNSSVKNIQKLEEMAKEDIIVWAGNNYEIKALYQSRINIIPQDTLFIKYSHNQDKIIAITSLGELVVERIKDLGSHNIKGSGINLKEKYELQGDIVFVDILSEKFDGIVMLTNQNNIKKIKRELIESFKKFPTKIMGLENGEKIIDAKLVLSGDNMGLLSTDGILLLFKEANIRASGKTAGGVKGIHLQEGDKIANMFVHRGEMFIFVYSNNAGKLISLEDCKIQKRGQAGLMCAKLQPGEKIMGGMAIEEGAVSLMFKDGEVKTIHSNDIKLKNRVTKLESLSEKNFEKIYRPWEETMRKQRADLDEQTNETPKSTKESKEQTTETNEDIN